MAPVNFINSFNDSSENNFPIVPFPEITPFVSSKVKYANPDAPSLLAHLSIPSKKLLGLSAVFFVTIALTIFPFTTNFLKISNLTSSLSKILLTSEINNGFLKSGLSEPYLSIDSS